MRAVTCDIGVSVDGFVAGPNQSLDNPLGERGENLHGWMFLRRHDRINNWDFVDLAARDIVRAHVANGCRNVLYQLARSPHWPERRTAIVATSHFIARGDLDDAFVIAELLLADDHGLIHKAHGLDASERGHRGSSQTDRLARRARSCDAAGHTALRDRAPRAGAAEVLPRSGGAMRHGTA